MVSLPLWLALLLTPLQIVVGDLHGENTLAHQPQKVAAMEGDWRPPAQGEGEPIRLFAIPDQQAQQNHAELAIPQLGSLYLRHNLHDHIQSLSEFPAADIPPVMPVFYAFRLMFGLGMLMLVTSVAALILRLRRRLYHTTWLLKWLVLFAPAGFIAILAGWVVTEMGRQPWTVWRLLRTEHSVSAVPPGWVMASSAGLLIIYLLGFALGLRYFLHYVATDQPVTGGQEHAS